MNLYYIQRKGNTSWDEYEGAVVVAETELEAKNIHPRGGNINQIDTFGTWMKDVNLIEVKLIGIADGSLKKGDVVCASFNAG